MHALGLGRCWAPTTAQTTPPLLSWWPPPVTVRWLGHAARKPNDTIDKQLLHSTPGHPRPMGRPNLSWMDTAMHDMGT